MMLGTTFSVGIRPVSYTHLEFIIDGDTLIPPFVAMDGLGENVAKQIVRARKEGEFLSKTELRKRGGVSSTLVEKMEDVYKRQRDSRMADHPL